MRSTCVALLVVIAAGCGCDRCGDKGSEVVARLDDRHTLAAPVTVGNLTVWPVRADRPLDLGEFLTLEEALAKGAAEVREVGAAQSAPQSAQVQVGDGQIEVTTGQQTRNLFVPDDAAAPEPAPETAGQTLEEAVQAIEEASQQLAQQFAGGATVGTLVIENKGDLPILVCAGTVVKGGNQDRQIGQDFVIKARSETPVDAFCVEQGRWQSERLGADTGGKFQVLDGMATAKVRAKGQYEKDQGAVWDEVRDVRTVFNTTVSPEPASDRLAGNDPEVAFALVGQPILLSSSSYAVAFDANAAASKDELKRCEDAVKARFAAADGAVGFAYAINGKPVAVRTFAHPRLLGKHLDSFVRGMATEALLAKDEPKKPADAKDVVTLVAKISASPECVGATTGLNQNGIRLHEKGYNANCYVADKEGNLLPLTQDWTAK